MDDHIAYRREDEVIIIDNFSKEISYLDNSQYSKYITEEELNILVNEQKMTEEEYDLIKKYNNYLKREFEINFIGHPEQNRRILRKYKERNPECFNDKGESLYHNPLYGEYLIIPYIN